MIDSDVPGATVGVIHKHTDVKFTTEDLPKLPNPITGYKGFKTPNTFFHVLS